MIFHNNHPIWALVEDFRNDKYTQYPYRYPVSLAELNDDELKTFAEIADIIQAWAIEQNLDYFREEIRNERMSYGDIVNLQGYQEHIPDWDVELLSWAGVEEGARR